MVPMDQKEEVKSKADIVEVISSYIPLKRAGRNFSGLCPFHSEKTPSFMVSGERQVFKCFGCGEGGDVFTFLEKIEGYDFREALLEVAKRVGVTIKSFKPSEQSHQKDKILAVNELAGRFYSYILLKHKKGEPARQYLKERGINEDIWKKYGLGFAPEGWENASSFLKKRNFKEADVAASGLVIARERASDRSYYDRFRNRLIFPIRDGRGITLGFSGRLIEGGSRGEGLGYRNEPKYLNSPETEVFHKGMLLFGLDVAREAIRSTNEVLLVEGEFDVLSAHQIGVKNVVASKGTALTEKQIATLARLSENVILCFDTDLAGDKASRRGIELMDMVGLTVKVVGLGKYKDPDEFCHQDALGFSRAVKTASNIYDYFLESSTKRFDRETADGQKKIGREILPILSKITDDLVRAHYVGKLAKVLDLDVGLVSAAVEKKQSEVNTNNNNRVPTADLSSQPGEKLSLEEFFLVLFLLGDEVNKAVLKQIEPGDFEKEECLRFWTWLSDIIRASKTKNTQKLLKNLPKDLVKFVDSLYLVNVGSEFLDKDLANSELIKLAFRIKENSIRRKLLDVSQKIRKAEMGNNNEQIKSLTQEFSKLSGGLKKKDLND